VVWTRSQVDKEKGHPISNLWITRVDDGESWALTHGKDRFASPQNPDDAERLAELIATLPSSAPLLREAGSSGDATGDPAIYDLGGNVSQWVTGPNGTGELAPGSADRPADRSARRSEATEAYRGLRVVVGR
jgi:hypothetical protein